MHPNQATPTAPASNSHATSASTSAVQTSSVFLQTARAWVVGKTEKELVRILLDTGSQRTFVKRARAEQLQCPVLNTEELTVFTVENTNNPSRYHCRLVALTLQTQYCSSKTTVEALEVPEFCTIISPPLDTDIVDDLHKRQLLPADVTPTGSSSTNKVDVLIGSDLYWKVTSGDIHRLNGGLTAVQTSFGRVVQGSYPGTFTHLYSLTSALFLSCSQNSKPYSSLDPSTLWRLDAIGITDSPDSTKTEHPALRTLMNNIVKKDCRYEVPLMIKFLRLGTSNANREISGKRLLLQLRRYCAHPDVLQEYDRTICEYFSENPAERVPSAQRNKNKKI